MDKKLVEVVAAVIENENNEILCDLRSPIMVLPNMWEFPGGKIEKGESEHEACLLYTSYFFITLKNLSLFIIFWQYTKFYIMGIWLLFTVFKMNFKKIIYYFLF